MTTPPAIRIDNIVKRYAPPPKSGGEGKLALKGVSFDVPQGKIFGLLGPNGAGKSTLINILAGMVMKTSGHASIWGFDIDHDMRNAKKSIGIVPQEVVFDPFFTPFEVLENTAGLCGVRQAAAALAGDPAGRSPCGQGRTPIRARFRAGCGGAC